MIGNIYRGEGARGLLDYLSAKDGAVLLATNLDGSSPKAFARQIGEVRRLHPKETLAKPVCHIPLRPSPGEDLTDQQWEEVLELTLERMGYSNSPYVAYLHDHGDGRHLHIATYRVTFEGRLVSDSNDRYRVMDVAREIEAAYGLTVAEAKRSVRLTRPALERLLRDPDRSTALDALRRTLDQAAAKHDTLRGFLTELHRLGVPATVKVARNTGVLQGITFTMPDGATLKGSDLGKKYSLANLCNRHELRTDRKPEGPILVATEVTDREHARLQREGLTADLALRYGSRRSLFWRLPPNHEQAFTDLLALRLPHRFLSFTDRLPEGQTAAADLEDRARQVQLLLELAAEGATVAPALPLPSVVTTDVPHQLPAGLAECAQRCQALSAALADSAHLSPSEGSSLRAEYHGAMTALLAALPPSSLAKPAPDAATGTARIEPDQFAALASLVSRSAGLETSLDSHRVSGAQIEPDQFAPSSAVLAEPPRTRSIIELARQYEGTASPETFHAWARALQFQRVSVSRLGFRGDVSQLPAAVKVLGADLLQAQDRYTAEPTEANHQAWRIRQTAYETLARRERSALMAARHRLAAAETRFLASPTDSKARAEWIAAAGEVNALGLRLAAAQAQALEALHGTLRQSAATLAFYEESYLRAPSPLTERLWRQAERDHLRSSLVYERARIASEAVPARNQRASIPPRTRELNDASRALGRIFEKHLLGDSLRADTLARRAASRVWARTPVGRALLTAAHPLRSAIAALPGANTALSAAGASVEVVRRALAIYSDLRAASDRLRSRNLPRELRRLEHGDFSSRSLATAVVRAGITETPPTPRSLAEAVRGSRSSEAALLRTHRGFRRGLSSHADLVQAAARALAARAAVTERIHAKLGLPSFRDFTAALGTAEGRSTSAWIGTLQRAGLSARAIASGLTETSALAVASASAAVVAVAVRQLVRWTLNYFRANTREIVREQNEQRR